MNLSPKSGFICIGPCSPDEFDFALFDYTNLQFLNDNEKITAQEKNHVWTGFGCGSPPIEEIMEKANKFRVNFEKRENHQYLYQVVHEDTINPNAGGLFTVVYGNKYVYKSTLNASFNNRLIVIPCDDPLITTSHLPIIIPASLEFQEMVTQAPDDYKQIRESIDLNSRFGRLLCAILSYQGFEKAYTIIEQQRELATCVYKKLSAQYTFNHLLAALAMTTIVREYDRGCVQFPSSDQLVQNISTVFNRANNQENARMISDNGCVYLLVQSLYEYIGSKFFSSFPWCCGCSVKSKQRTKLKQIRDDLLSLTTTEMPKNKQSFPEVQKLRLNQLATLRFPIADVRPFCVRSYPQMHTWQTEQVHAKNQAHNTIENQPA